mmetsp:Transcript_7968/g.17512  ORF Transcript_7968/g.17512 Transcript_7968/m.17512 type:complete len:285 (+) Transcript_7968:2-856(+)
MRAGGRRRRSWRRSCCRGIGTRRKRALMSCWPVWGGWRTRTTTIFSGLMTMTKTKERRERATRWPVPRKWNRSWTNCNNGDREMSIVPMMDGIVIGRKNLIHGSKNTSPPSTPTPTPPQSTWTPPVEPFSPNDPSTEPPKNNSGTASAPKPRPNSSSKTIAPRPENNSPTPIPPSTTNSNPNWKPSSPPPTNDNSKNSSTCPPSVPYSTNTPTSRTVDSSSRNIRQYSSKEWKWNTSYPIRTDPSASTISAPNCETNWSGNGILPVAMLFPRPSWRMHRLLSRP